MENLIKGGEISRFSVFCDGSCSISYNFLLEGNTLQLERSFRDNEDREIVLTFSLNNIETLARKYIQFVAQETQLVGIYQEQILPVITKLSKFPVHKEQKE